MYRCLKAEFLLFLLILSCLAFVPSRVEAKKLTAQETYNNQVTAYHGRGHDRDGWSWGASYDYDPYYYNENRPYYYYDDPYYYEGGGNYNDGIRVRTYRK